MAAAAVASGFRKTWYVGLALCVAGPCAFGVQMLASVLGVPWYMPILCTAGALMMVFATVKTWGAWRGLLAILALIFGFYTWTFVLVDVVLPPYSGAIKPGQPLPTFSALRHDGRAFTHEDLRAMGKAALVAYRSW